ncbi:MAG: nucleotidyltransferase domain-containing protein [Kofleriaceae bacterium]|nr:nucleotidyltransferase domain-containing protein [Myxococcales bacterium]MCB9561706.1 nucleotidyltransferase domain-containing protein [Kofleriaceae bacterium]MCB9573745.1 nucleotidyltransferase domain-containing protein [Kofleriaceae bacterium]
MIETLTDAPTAAVIRAHLAREAARRHHLVVYLSGAHAYGFPSPDSDYDLKCVHVAPTAALVGLVPHEGGAEHIEVVDGVELDYGSNEVGAVLRGVLRGNGNFLERLLGALVIDEDAPRMASLRPLVRGAVSRLVFRHYAGFAHSQIRAAEASQPPPAKKVLYALRTALTGAHLLRTGVLITDLGRLCEPYGFGGAQELIAAKRAGERVPLAAEVWERWRGELGRAVATLAEADRASPLPATPPDEASRAIEAWLVAVRRERFEP